MVLGNKGLRPIRVGWKILLPITLLCFFGCQDRMNQWHLDMLSRPDLLEIHHETNRLPLWDIRDPVFESGIWESDGGGCWSYGWKTVLKPAFITPGKRTLVIRAMRPDIDALSKLTVQIDVNGHLLPPLSIMPGWHDYRVVLPEHDIRYGINQVTLSYSKVFQPYLSDPASTDRRHLAVKFRELVFVTDGGSLNPIDYPPRLPDTQSPSASGQGVSVSLPALIRRELFYPAQTRLRLSMDNPGMSDTKAQIFLNGQILKELMILKESGASATLDLPHSRHTPALLEICMVPSSHAEGSQEITISACHVSSPNGWRHLAQNGILITLDTLRKDALGCYGNPMARTPVLDRLSLRSAQFLHAYSHVPITGPAHASIFTGRYPHEAGVLSNIQPLSAKSLTFPRILRAAGFYNAGFVSAGVLNRKFGYHSGFAHYQECISKSAYTAGETNEHIREFLNGWNPMERFFFWFHYYDPHMPYSPPGLTGEPLSLQVDDRVIASWNIADAQTHTVEMDVKPGDTLCLLRLKSGKGCYVQQFDSSLPDVVMEKSRGWEFRNTTLMGNVWHVQDNAEVTIHNPSASSRRIQISFQGYDDPDDQTLADRYLQEVEYLDGELGRLFRLLQSSGCLDDALLMVTADHGESLGEHAFWGHIHQLYEPLLAVPLLLSHASIQPRCDTRLSSHVDLFPTILSGLLGVEPGDLIYPGKEAGNQKMPGAQWTDPPISDSEQLKPVYDTAPLAGKNVLTQQDDSMRARHIWGETFGIEARETIFSIRNRDRSLYFFRDRPTGAELEMYHLHNDPAELDAIERTPENQSLWIDPLMRLLREMIPGDAQKPEDRWIDPDTEKMLQSLGYISNRETND